MVTTQSWSPLNSRRRAGLASSWPGGGSSGLGPWGFKLSGETTRSESALYQSLIRYSLALLRHKTKCPAPIKRRICPSASSRFCPSWSAAGAGQDLSGAPRKLPEKRALYSAESPHRPAGATPVSENRENPRSDLNQNPSDAPDAARVFYFLSFFLFCIAENGNIQKNKHTVLITYQLQQWQNNRKKY